MSECFVNGSHKEPIVGIYAGKPICAGHAEKMFPRYQAQIMPLPEVASKIRFLQAAVPSGEYERVSGLLGAGEFEQALRTAYRSAATGLIGVIRGRVLQMIWSTDSFTGQMLGAFLQRAEDLPANKGEEAAYDVTFDLFETLSLQMDVVVEASTLLQYVLTLEERARMLPFTGDVLGGLRVQRLKLKGILEKPDGLVPEDLQPIEAELVRLSDRIQSVQDLKKSAKNEEHRRENIESKRGRSWTKRQHRERDRDWKSRLPRFNKEEDGLPGNVRLLRAS